MRLRPTLLALFTALALLLPGMARAEERIHFFGSDIQVQPDASLEIVETIRVLAEGDSIKRGIYRDFPTRYRTRFGGEARVDFAVRDVLRNGQPEPWATESLSNGVRIRIGDADTFLTVGEHEYRIRYTVTRLIGYFREYDQLYWNVTGNGWMFPIDVAQARIRLPSPARFSDSSIYTGAQGAQGTDARVVAEEPGDITFRTTLPLAAYQGLTVNVDFPKGIVAEPDARTRAGWFLADYGPPIVGLLGLLAILAYYFSAWKRAGRGPRAGTVVPIFAPPDGLSAAATRYIVEMGADSRAFAAALIELGVRRKLRLVEGEKHLFSRPDTTIEKTATPEGLLPAETAMFHELFESGDSILMDNKNHARFSAAQNALTASFKSQYEGKMFLRNWMWSARGVAVLIIAILCTSVAVVLAAPFQWSGAITTGVATLVIAAVALFLFTFNTERGSATRWLFKGAAILLGLVALGMGMAVFGMALTSGRILPLLIPLLSLPVVISAFWWMAAPTVAGRAVLDRIAGFRHYLSITEEARLEALHPPEKTPELFERYLPYAIALEVENDWADRFAGVLAASAAAAGAQGFAWYSGHSNPWSNPGSFVGQVGSSLASSVSSAATAPGSSSGSGGGGSSGGGGGGGGGGGW